MTEMNKHHSFKDALVKAGVVGLTSYLLGGFAYPKGTDVQLLGSMYPWEQVAGGVAGVSSLVSDGIHVSVHGSENAHERVYDAMLPMAINAGATVGMLFVGNPTLLGTSLLETENTLGLLKPTAIGASSEYVGLIVDNEMKKWMNVVE